MELVVVDPNCEGEDEEFWERETVLTHIVDVSGFPLLVDGAIKIPEDTLLRFVDLEGRCVDTKRGGGYLGNSHAEIEQVYKNSVLIVVRRSEIAAFLLGGLDIQGKTTALRRLVGRIESHGGVLFGNLASRDVLLQIFEELLEHKTGDDSFLGIAAEIAAFIRDSQRFSRATNRLTEAFDKASYYELGTCISLQEPAVAENDLIDCLSRNAKIYQTYENLEQFRKGFLEKNADAKDSYRKTFTSNWIQAILMNCLEAQRQFCDLDYRILAHIVGNPAGQGLASLMQYQSVRILVERELQVSSSRSFRPGRLMTELCALLSDSESRHSHIISLIQRVKVTAVPEFSLLDYLRHFNDRRKLDQMLSVCSFWSDVAGPLKELYDHIDLPDRRNLLMRIQTQASELPGNLVKTLIMPLCRDVAAFADTTSPHVQECIRDLVDHYIRRAVGYEPEKPDDWARPGEISMEDNSSLRCGCVDRINGFLLDPEAASLDIFCQDYSLRWRFHSYAYFETRDRENGGQIVMKTLKWWNEKYEAWEKRQSDALAEIERIPHAILVHCLGNEYDSIMSLEKLRVSFNVQLPEAAAPSHQQRSVAGTKRTHAQMSANPAVSEDELALDYRLMGCRPTA
ncbi:hypothetical protein LTR91_025800 [Friedmanniomyces endolithicus]|uniref:Uncharacterized protein n=1 Tax=Friedmanniomyces endolithicus TaxID=329885 RepID=A0AAN6JZ01_9PEZI|nr:hypothetical protein LTR75_017313 [Friedmanniomyces endolithicus]KAK0773300.1 hypothetical protein LTR59_015323 [Friedmanniomyces endolithicus]KAK0777771.1 hypothetical protein LTR38_015041 [Friedmanniomyces endolithicus]KAK0827955.1 hypothetical protein LTR03_016732 [Friedmanniomyces endolithicus]KAK0842871.1 hypothetical protein LTS02_016320 [Friedmanniomyces endolithicus]